MDQRETPKAADAFQSYVALGPGRSLRLLAEHMVAAGRYRSVPAALRMLAGWSSQHRWQERMAEAINDRTAAAMAEANELDAESFLDTSRKLAQVLAQTDELSIDAICAIREQVRPRLLAQPMVGLRIAIRQEAESMAIHLGISPEALIAEAEAIARREWGRGNSAGPEQK